MKTLDLMNVEEDDVLNRNEMKTIMAGSGGSGCLYCFTPNGSEGWYRQVEPDNYDEACRDIYPGYPSGDVSGGWDAGGSC